MPTGPPSVRRSAAWARVCVASLTVTLAMVVGCGRSATAPPQRGTDAASAAPATAGAISEPKAQPTIPPAAQPAPPPQPLNARAITLQVPHRAAWKSTYAAVTADPVLGPFVPALRAALEAPGDPVARLTALSAQAVEAAQALAQAGRVGSFNNFGLDPVVADLRLAFLVALGDAVAADPAPAAERKAALEALLALHDAPYPVGLPAPNPRVDWTLLLQPSAEAELSAHLEALSPTP